MTDLSMNDATAELENTIAAAYKNKTPLRIEGNNSKSFIGNQIDGADQHQIISSREHQGILSYDASELVIQVRSGTPLQYINDTLAEQGQKLPFEPASFNQQATIGGTIAANISGPARVFRGAARDYLLGANIINGKGDKLTFGGQVMKNVAGYDAATLMAGAYGTLGFLLDVSIKVLPKNTRSCTIVAEMPADKAINISNQLAAKNLPINASCHFDNKLYLRLSSSDDNTDAAADIICQEINGQLLAAAGNEKDADASQQFWQQINEQQHNFFDTDKPLARISLPATRSVLDVNGEQLIEWHGGLRWLKGHDDITQLRQQIEKLGGHVTAYKNYPHSVDYFQPLSKPLQALHQRLKDSFDPAHILNPGRLYKEF